MSDKRNIAIVGPSLSGKTTLFESLLFASGAIGRKGTVKDGTTVGDSAQEARDRQVSTEVSAASTEHNGISFTFIDCPGSIEFSAEARNAAASVIQYQSPEGGWLKNTDLLTPPASPDASTMA